MTYEELAKAILALPEEQRKKKAVVKNWSLPFEIQLEIDGFTDDEDLEEDGNFPFLKSHQMRAK